MGRSPSHSRLAGPLTSLLPAGASRIGPEMSVCRSMTCPALPSGRIRLLISKVRTRMKTRRLPVGVRHSAADRKDFTTASRLKSID